MESPNQRNFEWCNQILRIVTCVKIKMLRNGHDNSPKKARITLIF
jgi:hypothetical protein